MVDNSTIRYSFLDYGFSSDTQHSDNIDAEDAVGIGSLFLIFIKTRHYSYRF